MPRGYLIPKDGPACPLPVGAELRVRLVWAGTQVGPYGLGCILCRGGPSVRLVADNTIGVSFESSDTDTPGSSEQELMMSLAPKSSSHWGNPSNWNNLTLK